MYLISNNAEVFSVKSRTILKHLVDSAGYRYVSLYNGIKQKNESIHRLVAIHFIENKSLKYAVNHIDGNKANNVSSNLEWVTRSENEIHASENNLKLNNFNKKIKSNTSGFVGVSKKKRGKTEMWYAYCNYKKKTHFVGYYNTPEEASIARSEYMESNGIAKSKANPTTADVFADAVKVLKA